MPSRRRALRGASRDGGRSCGRSSALSSRIVAVAGGFAILRLQGIARDLKHARTLLESAGQHVEDGQLQSARTDLASAQQVLTTANGRLYGQVEFDLIAWAPVIRENLDSLRSSVSVALSLVDGGRRLLEITRPLESGEAVSRLPFITPATSEGGPVRRSRGTTARERAPERNITELAVPGRPGRRPPASGLREANRRRRPTGQRRPSALDPR